MSVRFSKEDFTPAFVLERGAPTGRGGSGKVGKMLSLWEDVLASSFPVERTSHGELSICLGDLHCLCLARESLLCMSSPLPAALAPSIGVFLLCKCSFGFSFSEINTFEAKFGALGAAESALMAQGLTGQMLKMVVWGFGSPLDTETKQS